MPWFTKQRKKARNTKQKKKTQKKQQIFIIKLRKDRFRMFRPHSKPILAIPTWFKADSGLFSCRLIQPDSAWFWPNRRISKLSRCESMKKKKKKKKLKRGIDAPAATSDTSAEPSQPRPCFIDFTATVNGKMKLMEQSAFNSPINPFPAGPLNTTATFTQ